MICILQSEMANFMQQNALQLYSFSEHALAHNEIEKAIDSCRLLNTDFPEFFDGWWLAGCIHLRLNKPEAGLISTSRALAIRPDDATILIQRIDFLSMLDRNEEVTVCLKNLAKQQSLSASLHGQVALMLSAERMHDDAIQHYLSALSAEPNNPSLHYNLAAAYRFTGNLNAAEASLDRCLKINYLDADAQGMRSSLRTQSTSSNHTDELLKVYADPSISLKTKSGICYALSKEFDDLGDPQKSFEYLKIGSDIRRMAMAYDVKIDETIIKTITSVFSGDFFQRTARGNSSAEPIFIIGLPRTGTTLLERILDSHSAIQSSGELETFGTEVMKLCALDNDGQKSSALSLINQSSELDLRRLGERYLANARPANMQSSHFIDKLPFNFLYAGLIHQALPNAKIINLTRHPMAACFAIYKQTFRDIYPFSYNLDDLGQYYIAYNDLMAHWHVQMPGVIHSVAYEDLVADTEKEVAKVLDFCGVNWESNCLKFYDNPSPSTTASASQVRRPVYSRSVDRWKAYREQLSALENRLVEGGINVD